MEQLKNKYKKIPEPARKTIVLLKVFSYFDSTDKDYLFAERVIISRNYLNIEKFPKIQDKIQ